MGLLSETDVTVLVADQHPSLESGSLTGLGLLLHWLDLHHFLRKGVVVLLDQKFDNLWLLDRDGESEDLLERLYLAGLDESSQLSGWLPLLILSSSWESATRA